ncbi:DUF1080 domain-containing protein [Luteolibacter yonseiensis]|uniref:DUF1080 domain-containing protein n=1 Tax=Luteolibacter yonseiensis TaxID=1144680 RepID=A0A934R644_9BACT|nr:DUF1080 domain-containing protein [Luteolibacter yonseiensis]MBK1816673.1 DUF1080 domain-containing protein [Luteolibacter yonseiensis]
MKPNPLLFLALTMTASNAQNKIHGYPDGPKLPGVPYVVHDPARPQPRIIETAGAVVVKPPSDAIVLFDGKSLDAWTPGWKIQDGSMVAADRDIQSKQSFGAVQMHFEWRLPKDRKVDGQGGGNSGVFMMGLYEVQVLQSNNNKTYPDGQAGSLYGQLPPLVNATSPQGDWNSYDITFVPPVYEDGKVTTPAKITIFHNGVCVQNGESYLGPTEHRKLASYPAKHPETAPLKLQFHGDPMEYRNMWIRPLGKRD